MVVYWPIGSILVLLLSSVVGDTCVDAKGHHHSSIASRGESAGMVTGIVT